MENSPEVSAPDSAPAEQIAAAPDNPAPAKPKIPRPSRQKSKTQITVRIEERLRKACLARATAEGLSITEAVEFSLWDWLMREREQDLPIKLRFVSTLVPLQVQKRGLGFLIYQLMPPRTPLEARLLSIVETILDEFMQSAGYPASMEELQQFFRKTAPPAAI